MIFSASCPAPMAWLQAITVSPEMRCFNTLPYGMVTSKPFDRLFPSSNSSTRQ